MAFGELVGITKDGVATVKFVDNRSNETTFTGKITVRPGGMMVFQPGVEPDAEPVVLTPEKIGAK